MLKEKRIRENIVPGIIENRHAKARGKGGAGIQEGLFFGIIAGQTAGLRCQGIGKFLPGQRSQPGEQLPARRVGEA